MGSVVEAATTAKNGGRRDTMSDAMEHDEIKVSDAYVPAERVFVPAVAMPGLLAIDDNFIERVLRVGGMLQEMGDKDEALACYEHFIGQLRRFTMISLESMVKDD